MAYSIAAIRKKANDILKDAHQKRIPIHLDEIAEYLEIDVLYEDLEDEMSGFLLVKNGLASAAINDNHHVNRQRFTLAHEIGHYCLHVDEQIDEDMFVDRLVFNRDKSASKGEIKNEIEANKFAAELLMPSQMLRNHIARLYSNKDLEDDETISALANDFKVSTTAMGYRLGGLGLVSTF